jgi:hypothetical protein
MLSSEVSHLLYFSKQRISNLFLEKRQPIIALTALFGKVDSLEDFCKYYQSSDIHVIVFTDILMPNEDSCLGSIRIITIRPEFLLQTTRLTAKVFKVYAPYLLESIASQVFWIDSNVRISSLSAFCSSLTATSQGSANLYCLSHRKTRPVFCEALYILYFGKESFSHLLKLLLVLPVLSADPFALLRSINWCGVLLYSSCPLSFCDDWWSFISRYSIRDQLSFPSLRRRYPVVVVHRQSLPAPPKTIPHLRYVHDVDDSFIERCLGYLRSFLQ